MMMSFLRFPAAILGVGIFSAASALASAPLPKPVTEMLPNGLRLVWFASDRLPVVNFEMIINSGTKDDPIGKSGTAELVAATLDRGAGGLSFRQIAEKAESLGATRSATADDDFVQVDTHGLAGDADVLMDLLAKLVREPEFPAEEVKREQARMLNSWNNLGDYGESLVDLLFRRALAQGTRYARGGFLSAHEFAALRPADLVRWWKSRFVPKNATLLIVGRVDQAALRARIDHLFGDWKSSEKTVAATRGGLRSLSFVPAKGEILLVDRPSLNQAQVRIGFRAPAISDPRHYPLTVANALLGEYFHSRLNTLIRDQLGLTYGIGSGYSYNRELATLTVSAATRNEATGQLIKKSLEVLRGLKSGPIPEEEVSTAKEYLVGGFPLSTATLEGVAGRWIMSDLYGLGPDRLNEFVPKVSAVKSADVVSAVSSSFDLDHLVIAVAGDAKTIEPALKKEGYRVRRVSARELIDGKF